MSKILIVDDDATIRVMLKTFFTKMQLEAETVGTARDCLKAIEKNQFDLLLIDYRLPDKSGLELLKDIREKQPGLPMILMTSHIDIRTAVQAIKSGAFEYITKPINTDEIVASVNGALSRDKAQQYTLKKKPEVNFISGEGAVSDKINKHIDLVAPTDLSVIIQGESGTGKEYVSKLIHQKSKRLDGPFVAIDCGALSKDLAGSELFGHVKGAFTGATQDKVGQFEAASGGTLFLDEIGNLSYDVQVKLLRAIQERKIRRVGGNNDLPIDVRIIAATNEDLVQFVKQGNFREDLYHRLNEFKIQIPPLRERGNDVEVFSQHFLVLANKELNKNITGFDEPVLAEFRRYSWPGNLRELKNTIKRAVLIADNNGPMRLETLPEEMVVPVFQGRIHPSLKEEVIYDLKMISEKNEKTLIEATLAKVKFNKSKAAKILNIDRKTLYNKLKSYGIEE